MKYNPIVLFQLKNKLKFILVVFIFYFYVLFVLVLKLFVYNLISSRSNSFTYWPNLTLSLKQK